MRLFFLQSIQRLKNMVVATAVMMSVSACDDPVGSLTDTFDSAIEAIQTESIAWQGELRLLSEELSDMGHDVLANHVQNLAKRTVATTSANFRCSADFLRDRVIQGLKSLRSTGALAELRPVVCSTVPSSVDLTIDPSSRGVLDFYGYDLDAGLSVHLVDADGTRTDITAYSALNSHYHMTVNISQNGVAFSPSSARIELLDGSETVSELLVIGNGTRTTDLYSMTGQCSGAGQRCPSAEVLRIQTSGLLNVQFEVGPRLCAPMRIEFMLDGVLRPEYAELGWRGGLPPTQSSIFELGPVAPGPHTLSLVAEGKKQGCNAGILQTWSGTLTVETD